ncbi:MAG TPA: hypothetical protein VF317_10950 [Dermatophilaceae bacterium]|jgi:uncharacterized membrane protein YeiB
MDATTNPRESIHWAQAVWGLRVMGPGLSVVLVGLATLLWSTSTGQAILAVGMVIYLVGVAITVTGIVLLYRELPPPRPNFINLRWFLLHDAVHARTARAEQLSEGRLGEPHAQSTDIGSLRHSVHWRPAVWGVRVMGLGVAVALAGLIALLLWSTAGKAILVVGLGIYVVGAALAFVEASRAYTEAQPPCDYARIQRILLHDALRARP